MWKECFNSSVPCATKCEKKRCMPLLGICDYCYSINFLEDSHCSSCHRMYGASVSNLNIFEHMACCVEKLMMDVGTTLSVSSFPLRIRILKLLLAILEASVPPGAFLPVWTNGYRKSWGMKLRSSSSADELLQILTLLEGAIKKDYLSSNFETTIELLGLISASQCDAKYSCCIETVPVLPWLPQTTAAMALRLMEFDASILYMLKEKANSEKHRSTNGFIFPYKCAVAKSTQHHGSTEDPHQGGLFQKENWTDIGTGLGGLGPGQGSRGHTHGGRIQRRVIASTSKAIKKKASTNMNADVLRQMTWKAQPRSRRGHRRGRCSLISRQKSIKKAVNIVADRNNPRGSNYEDSSGVMVDDEWLGEEKRLQVDGTQNASSSEIFEYDRNSQARGDEYEDLAVNEYASAFSGRPSDILKESCVNLNGNGEYQDDDNADEQGEIDLEEYINGDSAEKRIENANVGPKGDPDYGTGFISSDFSD
uniref:Uncharacterized protein n=1 Tax=Rhizophora mucronata TaxID=61149 RepID=A0A2P2JPH5_RHIMU